METCTSGEPVSVSWTRELAMISPFCSTVNDTLFNRLGSLVNYGLGLFQTQAREFADNLDDVDLVGTNLAENSIELGLFLNRCSSLSWSCRATTSRPNGHGGSSAHAPPLLQGF